MIHCQCCGWNINRAISMGCISCFKRCTIPKTVNGRPMLNAHILVNCAKYNCPVMFKHALKEYVDGRVPPETWDIRGREYEVVTHVVQHRNPTWYPYIMDFVSRRSTNPRNIALLKLAIKVGDTDISNQIYPYLKPRTTETATRKDLTDFMECAAFSGQIHLVRWVEQHFNERSDVPWPSAWKNNGRRLIEMIFKNKERCKRRHLEQLVVHFAHIFERVEIHCWDTVAKLVLSFKDDYPNVHRFGGTSLFGMFWTQLDGRRHATPSWKNYCIRWSKHYELEHIHTQCPEWPADFLALCESTPGRNYSCRHDIRRFASENGLGPALQAREPEPEVVPTPIVEKEATNLQKALAIIEDCDIQEGKYLEICKWLLDVHRRGVC